MRVEKRLGRRRAEWESQGRARGPPVGANCPVCFAYKPLADSLLEKNIVRLLKKYGL